MRQQSKNESIQDALRLVRYTLSQVISIYGPLNPNQEEQQGYVMMMHREMQKRQSFEEWQTYFTLLHAYNLVDSVIAVKD